MLKLIATDIDGTLVPDGTHDLNPAYYDVIRELTDLGMYFCVCSGRQYKVMREMFDPVADRIYFICENGNILRTRDRILKQWNIDEETVRRVLDDIGKIPDVRRMVSTSDTSYIECTQQQEPYPLLTKGYGYHAVAVDDIFTAPLDNVCKVTIYSDGDIEEQAANFADSHWSDDLLVNCSGFHWIDVSSREGGKGHAFALLKKLLGLSRGETMYYGDNMNDLPAFAEAGITGTVANAREEVRKAADLIEKSFEEDGVLEGLKRIAAKLH